MAKLKVDDNFIQKSSLHDWSNFDATNYIIHELTDKNNKRLAIFGSGIYPTGGINNGKFYTAYLQVGNRGNIELRALNDTGDWNDNNVHFLIPEPANNANDNRAATTSFVKNHCGLPSDEYTDYSNSCTTNTDGFVTFCESAPYDGWLSLTLGTGETSGSYQCAIKNATLGMRTQVAHYGWNSYAGGFLPVRKGDTLQYAKESGAKTFTVKLFKLR